VHPGDDDPTFATHDRSQRFRAPNRRNVPDSRIDQDRVVILDRGGKNNQLRVARILGTVGREKAKPELRQSFGLEGAGLIGATNVVSELIPLPATPIK
jgi:hypothetical protein